MAHRIQMKLGVVPDAERAPDSPDTALHIEPRVGAQTRTKGHLYLLVTSRVPGARARDATRLVADAIRSEYYYDESAGIRVCLVKAIQVANKRLSHARERSALGSADPGPIGVGLAVVRDNELYVCTVGPAEAYLNRGARLSTLPDPHRDRGLPSPDVEPDVWRGEINVGDQLVLVSPSVVGALGADVLKDALVTLHPQSAVESLTARFHAGGGTGSDGTLIIEAAEIAVTRSGVVPVPVRPAEPLAGMPDRSPIPLADSVAGGLAAAQHGARRARGAAGGVLYRLLTGIQDRLPSRGVPNRRVTPLSTRREMQRRAAMALLALVVVVGGLGAAAFLLGGRHPTGSAIATLDAAQGALETARGDLSRVVGPGVDLVVNDPTTAARLLTEAYTSIQTASSGGIPTSTTSPIKTQIVAALDRLYRMTDVASSPIFTFPDTPAVDLKALVQGPDGAPFVLDAATKTVYRIDLANRKASAIFRAGSKPSTGGTEGTPMLLAVGGRDLLMVDDKNVVWRWRPANATGKGTITRVQPVTGAASWGNDVLAIGTFIRDAEQNLYNLYVVDPSQQQILRYSPAADGGGFPGAPNPWLTAARDVSGVTSMYIDGDVWLADGGQILRLVSGNSAGWTAAAPGDSVIRGTPAYRIISSASDRRTGTLYGYDPAHQRLVAFSKASGSFIGQYRLADGATGWSDIRGFYVQQGVAGAPDTIVWLSAKGIQSALLQPAGTGPGGSPSPSSAASPAAASPAASR
ncbi:MAG TPA: hypothetical protein VE011_05120 [Candidatus Dormibacteraeota bacterium]|nr:hypothetical protein [Candidatus Dormibacteraeota bacterium]